MSEGELNEMFLRKANQYFNEIVEFRRHIHKNPELSFREIETSKYVADKLKEMGIDPEFCCLQPDSFAANGSPKKTGVIASIGSGEKCIALRADIDALPIQEETNLEFQSSRPGVMHACGHDFHTAMLLGAAKILKSIEKDLPGKILLIFQPAEELIPGGASSILSEGVFERFKPVAIFGQHIFPHAETGKICITEKPSMASGDELYWTLAGAGSHAAQPHAGRDPIAAAAAIVNAIPSLIVKNANPLEPIVISVTSIQAGSVTNIFPDEAIMLGTMRTFNQELRERFYDLLPAFSSQIAAIYGVECKLNIKKGFPAVINDAELATLAIHCVKSISGAQYEPFEPKMWAEDYGYYTQRIPGLFWYLGVAPAGEELPPIHNSKLQPDENAMKYGVAALCAVAHKALTSLLG